MRSNAHASGVVSVAGDEHRMKNRNKNKKSNKGTKKHSGVENQELRERRKDISDRLREDRRSQNKGRQSYVNAPQESDNRLTKREQETIRFANEDAKLALDNKEVVANRWNEIASYWHIEREARMDKLSKEQRKRMMRRKMAERASHPLIVDGDQHPAARPIFPMLSRIKFIALLIKLVRPLINSGTSQLNLRVGDLKKVMDMLKMASHSMRDPHATHTVQKILSLEQTLATHGLNVMLLASHIKPYKSYNQTNGNNITIPDWQKRMQRLIVSLVARNPITKQLMIKWQTLDHARRYLNYVNNQLRKIEVLADNDAGYTPLEWVNPSLSQVIGFISTAPHMHKEERLYEAFQIGRHFLKQHIARIQSSLGDERAENAREKRVSRGEARANARNWKATQLSGSHGEWTNEDDQVSYEFTYTGGREEDPEPIFVINEADVMTETLRVFLRAHGRWWLSTGEQHTFGGHHYYAVESDDEHQLWIAADLVSESLFTTMRRFTAVYGTVARAAVDEHARTGTEELAAQGVEQNPGPPKRNFRRGAADLYHGPPNRRNRLQVLPNNAHQAQLNVQAHAAVVNNGNGQAGLGPVNAALNAAAQQPLNAVINQVNQLQANQAARGPATSHVMPMAQYNERPHMKTYEFEHDNEKVLHVSDAAIPNGNIIPPVLLNDCWMGCSEGCMVCDPIRREVECVNAMPVAAAATTTVGVLAFKVAVLAGVITGPLTLIGCIPVAATLGAVYARSKWLDHIARARNVPNRREITSTRHVMDVNVQGVENRPDPNAQPPQPGYEIAQVDVRSGSERLTPFLAPTVHGHSMYRQYNVLHGVPLSERPATFNTVNLTRIREASLPAVTINDANSVAPLAAYRIMKLTGINEDHDRNVAIELAAHLKIMHFAKIANAPVVLDKSHLNLAGPGVGQSSAMSYTNLVTGSGTTTAATVLSNRYVFLATIVVSGCLLAKAWIVLPVLALSQSIYSVGCALGHVTSQAIHTVIGS